MKKQLIVCVLFLFLTTLAFGANCPNPIGNTYEGGNFILKFQEAFGPGDGIIYIVMSDGDEMYIPYNWDEGTCRATLETESEIQYYLDMGDGWLSLTDTPKFKFVPIDTVNFGE